MPKTYHKHEWTHAAIPQGTNYYVVIPDEVEVVILADWVGPSLIDAKGLASIGFIEKTLEEAGFKIEPEPAEKFS